MSTYSAKCRNGHDFDPEQTLKSLKDVQAEMWRELGADSENLPAGNFMSVTLLCPKCGARVHHDGRPDPYTGDHQPPTKEALQ